ncbi:DUF1653 domain-containing protein [Candidatus Parcubacteria bacterium]|uniref:DUF1653 domain-containing protein n=1 Tax=Candidatus Kaiserbacteria bacterium CG10_big_fil_rev_8_21_14_0_10_47_16 TaxID=1974608 RepID=A0A2H0UEA4_9BACT|nr:DUF1653 domain-containing protein [Candidatus Parcubacteria bacterium]PIR84732.1 MAG: DUF1653 domain-containing protein [Candidatus Kaiserbacteria bacterium CG10_big_fil_rev_8_21_14_0_10_47_16]
MKELKAGQRYRHFRTQNTYIILGIGHHTETVEKLVIYQGEYEDPKFGVHPIWARPYEMFIEDVEVEGEPVERFTLIQDIV